MILKILLSIMIVLYSCETYSSPLSSGYIVQSHSYVWRADGSSATQGVGSILQFGSGTISCSTVTSANQVTQSQINSSFVPGGAQVVIPGSGTFIQQTCNGGATGGIMQYTITVPSTVIGNVLAGMFVFVGSGYNPNTITSLFLCPVSCGANRLRLAANNTTTYVHMQDGWNLIQGRCTPGLTFPDWFVEIGVVNCQSTMVQARFQVQVAADQTATFAFGDIIYQYYARPQITVWLADNDSGVVTNAWPYMDAVGRKIPGSYAPTSGEFGGVGITAAQLLAMQATGWSVHGHQSTSVVGNYTAMTAAQLDTELQLVRSQMVSNGFTPLSSLYVYPGGNRNEATDAGLYRNGFSGIAIGGNAGGENNGRPIYGGLVNNKLWSIQADSQSSTLTQAAINHAIAYGEQLALLYHTVPTVGCDMVCFQSTIDYLVKLRDANIIDITTLDGLVRRQANPRWNRLSDKKN
jgi:hypothetical protein